MQCDYSICNYLYDFVYDEILIIEPEAPIA